MAITIKHELHKQSLTPYSWTSYYNAYHLSGLYSHISINYQIITGIQSCCLSYLLSVSVFSAIEQNTRPKRTTHSSIFLIISSWNHTSCAHRRDLSWHFQDWRSWDNHPGPSPAGYTPCSSRRLRCRLLRRSHTFPGMNHSCTHRRPGQAYMGARTSRRWHTCHRISHTGDQSRCRAASGTWWDQDDASPLLSDFNLRYHSKTKHIDKNRTLSYFSLQKVEYVQELNYSETFTGEAKC